MAVINEDAKNQAASEPKKTRKAANIRGVALTADELRQQTSDQIGSLATSVSTPMMAAIKKTATQRIMLETVQSVPDILADANAGLEDFFASFDSEILAGDLTMNLLPPSAQLILRAA